MMKVFLKYNRDTVQSKFCLERWLKIFSNYDKYILTDITADYSGLDISDCKFINSNLKYADEFQHCFSGERWIRPGIANFTAYEYAKNDMAFWLIDADDTIIQHSDVNLLQSKFKSAEQYFSINNLDGFSLDFYREFTGQWSFGVALLNGTLDMTTMFKVSDSDIPEEYMQWKNIDMIFDILRRINVLKLESFVINDCAFTHLRPDLEAAYYWSQGKLWDRPLADGVIVF